VFKNKFIYIGFIMSDVEKDNGVRQGVASEEMLITYYDDLRSQIEIEFEKLREDGIEISSRNGYVDDQFNGLYGTRFLFEEYTIDHPDWTVTQSFIPVFYTPSQQTPDLRSLLDGELLPPLPDIMYNLPISVINPPSGGHEAELKQIAEDMLEDNNTSNDRLAHRLKDLLQAENLLDGFADNRSGQAGQDSFEAWNLLVMAEDKISVGSEPQDF
jgi:hypothetical protein